MNEREMFEEWAYSNKWNIFRVRDMGIDRYVDDFVDGAWHGWQASVSRECYKIVPIEPDLKMIEAAAEEHALNGASYKTMYKAMIGVVE